MPRCSSLSLTERASVCRCLKHPMPKFSLEAWGELHAASRRKLRTPSNLLTDVPHSAQARRAYDLQDGP